MGVRELPVPSVNQAFKYAWEVQKLISQIPELNRLMQQGTLLDYLHISPVEIALPGWV